MANLTLSSLPTEILQNIVCLVSPEDAIALAQASHRLLEITYEPLVWRHFCLSRYRFWDDKWHSKLKGKEAEWRDVYCQKREIDQKVMSFFEQIITRQSGRIDLFQGISNFRYDAKDVLLEQTKVSQNAADYLSRLYWSRAILDHLHRKMAIHQWRELSLNTPSRDVDQLERSLGAFDLFLVDENHGDLDDIIQQLDNLACTLLEERPEILEASPREKALSVANYLKGQSIIGITNGRDYHDIEHNFIGLALSGEGHNSLPLISVVIYCSVMKKLGLKAQPCNFPFHVIAIIYPPSGLDLDGMTVPADSPMPPMYMDPWESGEEVTADKLRSQLARLLSEQTPYEPYLHQSSDNEIVLRSAKNILNSLRATANGRPATVDRTKAEYAALWAWLLLSPSQQSGGTVEHLHYGLHVMIESCINNFPYDASFLKQYLLPTYSFHRDRLRYTAAIDSFCQRDRDPKFAKERTLQARSRLKYRIGQVFKHRRQGYQAVIVGWDTRCMMDEQWIQMMRVDRLSGGRDQCFYNALVEDNSMRYVAADNIEIIEPEIFEHPPAFPFEAGKFFKRWDKGLHRFINNIRDEYPDD